MHSLHTHRMQPISSSQAIQTPPGLQGNSDEEGSEEGAHGIGTPAANGTLETGTLALEATIGSPAQPYVSEFGSLPLRMTEGSSLQLNRILLTHAPHMNKLESLASSATRWGRREVGWEGPSEEDSMGVCMRGSKGDSACICVC